MKTSKIKNLLSLLITLMFMASLMFLMSTCQKDFELEADYLSLDELQENKIKTSETSVEYDAVRLGWPYHTNMRITGFNNEGQILGFSEATSYLWHGGVLIPLRLLNGAESCRAFDMNAGGIVVGACKAGSKILPVYWNTGSGISTAPALELSLDDSFQSGTARGINDNGVIVGYVSDEMLPGYLTQFDHKLFKAVSWDNINSNPQPLPYFDPGTNPDSFSSIAIYINNDGYIAGGSNTYNATGNVIESRGVIWTGKEGSPIQLDIWEGRDRWTDNHRLGMNNQGDVASISLEAGQEIVVAWIYDGNSNWNVPVKLENAYTGQVGVPYQDLASNMVNVPGAMAANSNWNAVMWGICRNSNNVSVIKQLPFPEELVYENKFGIAVFTNDEGWIAGLTRDRRNPRFYNDMDVTLWTPRETTEDPDVPGDPDPIEPDDPGNLSIEQFDLTNTSNPQFARVRVNWAVSGENLAAVEVSIVGEGNTDARTWSVSGNSAAGEHEFSFRRGFGSYNVTLTVTDGNGTISQTGQITL